MSNDMTEEMTENQEALLSVGRVPGMTLVTARVGAPGRGALISSVDELLHQDEPNAILTLLDAGKMNSESI